MALILFFFIRKSRPLTCRPITSSLRARRPFQFSVGVTPSMPYLSACFRWSHNSAENSIALVGMQPQRRQVPPSRSFASIKAAFRPYWEARIAQVYPAGPPPSTTRSKIVSAKGTLHVGGTTQTILFDSPATFWIPPCKDCHLDLTLAA